jgi:hypothetical protein
VPVIFVAGQWLSHGGVPVGPPLWNEMLATLTRAFYQFPHQFRLEAVREEPPYSHRLCLPTGDQVWVRTEPLTEEEARRCLLSPRYGRFSVIERDRAARHLWPAALALSPGDLEAALSRADLSPGESVEAAMRLGLAGDWGRRE